MIKLATLFSGIGSVEQAMLKLKVKHKIIFACDNGEIELNKSFEEIKKILLEIPKEKQNECVKELYRMTGKINYMYESYKNNYKINDKDFYYDVRYLDGKKYENKIDLLVGGSPCQSFSIIGKRGGFNDTRGTLFYEYARIIKETKPKVFIFENVRGLITHDKGKTWEVVQNSFNELNYKIYIRKNPILNAKNFGIPQNRPRLFVIGFRRDIVCENFEFPNEVELNSIVSDYLEKNSEVNSAYYLGKKGFEFVTNPKYKNRAQVNSKIMSCQKANQQFNWNGEFVFVPYTEISNNTDIINKAYVSKYNNIKGVIRKLTPNECIKLMGFSDSFTFPNIPDTWKYRQAGNSIVVNMFECLIPNIIKTGVFKNEKNKKY